MKKNSFLKGAFVATAAIIIVKIIGVLYVIPFYAIVGEKGGALYGYAYNIYMIFLGISSAGLPFAISKIIGEYDALGYNDAKERANIIIKKIVTIISVIGFLILMLTARNIADLIVGPKGTIDYINDVTFVIRMVSFALLVVPFLSVTKGYLQGHKYITPASISQIIEQVVRVIVIIGGSYLSVIVFHLDLKIAIGISAFAAFIGGLFAYIYLYFVIKKNKSKFYNKENVKSDIKNKEIINKIAKYAVPFIITGIAFNIYNFADTILVRRTLTDILNWNLDQVEVITAIYATWASKLLMIVIAFGVGLVTSLIPNIVYSYTKGDIKDVNNKFNKSIQVILLVIVPVTLFSSILAKPIWTLFYGESFYGPLILKVFIFTALITSFYTKVANVLQGMNKYKVVYFIAFFGIILNIVLNIPLMLLFHKFGLFPVWGASISTVISMGLATFIGLEYLKRKEKINYGNTLKMIPSLLVSWLIFIVTLFILRLFIPYTLTTRLIQIPIIILYFVISFGIYTGINYYNGNIKKVFNISKISFKNFKIKVSEGSDL